MKTWGKLDNSVFFFLVKTSQIDITMAQDPRETFRKLQQSIRNARGSGSGMPGGPQGVAAVGLGALILGGVYLASNALFNGQLAPCHRAS